MKTYEKLTAVFLKQAYDGSWHNGNTSPSTHADPGYDAIAKTKSAKKVEMPKAESATNTVNNGTATTPEGSGAMTRPLWYGNRGVIAGTGSGTQFTSGVSGEGLRA
jgi:hypothetical protein